MAAAVGFEPTISSARIKLKLLGYSGSSMKGIVKMNPKIVHALKIAAVILIGLVVVIFLGANKIASSIVLTVTAIVILLPIGESKWLKWGRLAFVLVALAFVLRNVSTTEYLTNCYNTGFRFFDQVLHIFDRFLQTTFGTSIVDPQCRPITRPFVEK